MEKNIEKLWKDNTNLIRTFIEKRNDYESLCSEISYILKKNLSKNGIEFSTINFRAKTLNSFLEKIQRKTYKNPFEEITDFAGVRIVYLYQTDLEKIEEIIKKEFTIHERIDKLNDKGSDKFGYGAIHYLVRIGKNSFGARYDDLKNLICEIQVKTVLQDAWSIIDHHLVYKRESEIPTALRRKLNSLAGLFETADNQFGSIKKEREQYLKDITYSSKTPSFLDNELNLDTFIAYLKWKFPKLKLSRFKGQIKLVFEEFSILKLITLKDLDIIISKYKKEIPIIKKKFEDEFSEIYFDGNEIPSSLLVSIILQIDNKEYLEECIVPEDVKEFIKLNY